MTMVNYTYVDANSVKLIPDSSRPVFFWIILIISVVTLVGNVFAIKSVAKKVILNNKNGSWCMFFIM
ncbi:hypothetical protein NQ314_006205 [Rhamnusium bicolor]|uniref:Uncharacterized protein n=1 Tax=Rhamnusium bicolor TaxID=1586634 RepID=A0AAV8Z7A2_9CUCU|nr:hypothetical protein NQ314_006205 [Rhamnusium bicolor]